MKINFYFFLIVLLQFVFLVACSTQPEQKMHPTSISSSPQQSKDFKRIKDLHAKGEIKAAINLLNIFIERHPSDEAYFLLGTLYYQQKKYKNAYTFFRIIRPNSNYGNQAKIQSAYSLSHLDIANKKKSYQLVKQILNNLKLSDTEKIRVYKLKDILLKYIDDEIIQQLETYTQLYQLIQNPTLKEKYNFKAVSLLQSKLNEDQLKQVIKHNSLKTLKSMAFFQLGSLYFDQGDFRQAKYYFKKALYWRLDEEYRDQAEKILAQINTRHKVNANTIGAILPLTGKDAAFGYKALRGLQLALEIYDHTSASDLRLAVIDSKSDLLVAKDAVQRLVLEDRVIAIVGGLMSKTAHSISSSAQKLLVPNIALSQKNDITEIGDYIFQNALTGQMQVDFLVERSMQKGLKNFAILYPNDRYGIEYAQLFWDSVLARQGQIVAVQTYTKEETDFREQIQRMIGTFYKNDRQAEFNKKLKLWRKKFPNSRKNIPNNLLEPLVFFDALFIPDGIKVLGQVAPMLVYNDIENMILLGTNLWNTPLLSQRAGQFLRSSIFVDSFSMSDENFISSDFYKNYIKVFNQKPHILELQAFEAGLILKKVIEEGADTRQEAQKMLTTINLDGVLGSLQMTEKRQVRRPMAPLTYDQKTKQISKLSHSK